MSEIKRKMSGNDLSLIIRYLVMIAVGVLFCLSPAFGKSALSTILGIGFIVTGAVFLIISLAVEKSLISGSAFIGYFAIALGILAIAANVMSLVFDYVPYFIITAGSGIVLDGILGLTLRKEKSVALLVIKLLVGGVMLALGICLLTVDSFKEFASVVLGIVLIITAIYGLFSVLSKSRPKVKNS